MSSKLRGGRPAAPRPFKYRKVRVQNRAEHNMLTIAESRRFNRSLLGLGQGDVQSEQFDALSALFDLEKFTSFSTQVDPHLVIPDFLETFFDWLFNRLREELTVRRNKQYVTLQGAFPVLSKFTGDGVLFVWDLRHFYEQHAIGHTIHAMNSLCKEYSKKLLPKLSKRYNNPPPRLRCGVARGNIVSIGGGVDFSGPCINMASRLQKIHDLSFACSRKGIDFERCLPAELSRKYLVKKVSIRGVGTSELIYVDRWEFYSLHKVLRVYFDDV